MTATRYPQKDAAFAACLGNESGLRQGDSVPKGFAVLGSRKEMSLCVTAIPFLSSEREVKRGMNGAS